MRFIFISIAQNVFNDDYLNYILYKKHIKDEQKRP